MRPSSHVFFWFIFCKESIERTRVSTTATNLEEKENVGFEGLWPSKTHVLAGEPEAVVVELHDLLPAEEAGAVR